MARKRYHRSSPRTGWDPVANWYAGWVGPEGSEHHRRLAIPAVLDLLALAPGEHVLDIGAGPGVLAPHVTAAGGRYTGLDASERLLRFARQRHGRHGRFIHGDAAHLPANGALRGAAFDAVVFMLSIQDMEPLEDVLRSAAWALRRGGRAVLLLTHPCFRVPRQSGWGWDSGRKLRYRRVDRYLTPLAVPMKRYGDGATRSFHRPLEAYMNGLAANRLLVERVSEIPGWRGGEMDARGADERAEQEIPLFLGLRAVRAG